MEIKNKIHQFLTEEIVYEDITIDPDASLSDKGILDSMAVLEVVAFLESTFQIQVEGNELIPANLDSINNLVGYLERKGVKAL